MKNDDKKTLDQNESNKPDESEKPQSESAPDKDTAEEKDELTLLKEENEAIIKELDEYKDKYLRLLAEYDNYRKRAAKEKAEIYPDFEEVEEKLGNRDSEEVKALIKDEIEKVKDIMPVYKRVKRFKIRNTEFEKTTTRKIRRLGSGVKEEED